MLHHISQLWEVRVCSFLLQGDEDNCLPLVPEYLFARFHLYIFYQSYLLIILH